MNAITHHPAYPSSAQLRLEAEADRIAAVDMAQAQTMWVALIRVRATIATMKFQTGFPVDGWDKESVLAALADMMPDCGRETEREMRRVALENLGGVP